MDQVTEEVLRGASASMNFSWGTTAPFSAGPVVVRKVGFADLKRVEVVITSPADAGTLVPLARQMVYRELETCGVSNAAVEFMPTVNYGRDQMFVDTNRSSESFNKRKRGRSTTFAFEITKDYECLFVFHGSRGEIRRGGVVA